MDFFFCPVAGLGGAGFAGPFLPQDRTLEIVVSCGCWGYSSGTEESRASMSVNVNTLSCSAVLTTQTRKSGGPGSDFLKWG